MLLISNGPAHVLFLDILSEIKFKIYSRVFFTASQLRMQITVVCSRLSQVYVILVDLPPWMLVCCSIRFLQEPRVDKLSRTQFFFFIDTMDQL